MAVKNALPAVSGGTGRELDAVGHEVQLQIIQAGGDIEGVRKVPADSHFVRVG
jgi:hypothetical protein